MNLFTKRSLLQKGFNVASIFLALTLLIPFHALPLVTEGISVAHAGNADVRITEIAWMGGPGEPNNEWIELHNEGSTPVDLLGWIIGAQDTTPVIEIGGADVSCTGTTISAGGYFILERTDDDSRSDVTADCIYGNDGASWALSNSGETIIVAAPGPEIIQGIYGSGADGWPAGDNDTKDTMQWATTTESWITATPTPGALPELPGFPEDEGEQCDEGQIYNPETQECEDIPEAPVCGDGVMEGDEECDDNNTDNGDGCSETCNLETLECSDVEEGSGWYAEYFNYSEDHPDMDITPIVPDDGHGDPLSSVDAWDTDWYDDEHFRFSRVDANLLFPDSGIDFFPFDIAPEELHNGGINDVGEHEFHFGVHWRALVETDSPGDYDFSAITDDDIWVYVDGVLVAENPGIHAPELLNGVLPLTGANVVDIFFAERHTVQSQFVFRIAKLGALTITPLPEECQPSVQVCKYHDLTGDGASEDDERYGEGWEFELSTIGEDAQAVSQETDGKSCTVFDVLPGEYVLNEENRTGWSATDVLVWENDDDDAEAPDSFFDIFVEVGIDEHTQIDVYNYNAPYCGDGVVNQVWEQCDGGKECTDQCQYEDDTMCRDLVLAQITTDNLENGALGDMTTDVYLGSAFNQIPDGTWFALYHNGSFINDADVSGYEDVPGYAVERDNGELRIVLHGDNTGGTSTAQRIEHVDGVVNFYNAFVTDIASDDEKGLGKSNKLEFGFNGTTGGANNDEVATSSATSVDFWLTTTTADDGFITSWEIDEDCSGICGYKFYDTNKNEEFDEDEEGLEEWKITLYQKEKVCDEYLQLALLDEDYQDEYDECYEEYYEIESTYTSYDGGYCFLDLEEGHYKVVEEDRAGWYPTTSLYQEVYVEGEDDKVYVDFGNVRKAKVHGSKYFDENKNGVRDDGEVGLPNWEIQIYRGDQPWEKDLIDLTDPVSLPQLDPVATTTTDHDGNYWFMDLDPGVYQVFEVLQPGWIQTGPGVATDTVELIEGTHVRPEHLLPPVQESLYSPTDPGGDWYRTKLVENETMKQIVAFEALCATVTCLTPEIGEALREIQYYSVLVEGGDEVENLDFGNWSEPGSIHGLKFHDLNGDGEWDEETEPGLANWEIRLYKSPAVPDFYEWVTAPFGNPPFAVTTTMENGEYWFEDVPPGIYQVFEVQQDGWVQTAPGFVGDALSPKNAANVLPTSIIPLAPYDLSDVPNPFEAAYDWYQTKLVQNSTMLKLVGAHGLCALSTLGGFPCGDEEIAELENQRYYSVLLGPGEEIEGAYFGNWQPPSSIHGVKYHDVNGNGVRDEGEEGLSGWEIQLFQSPNTPWEDSPLNTPVATTTTTDGGEYWFEDVPPGIYQVFEVQQDGWVQTAPLLAEDDPFDLGARVVPEFTPYILNGPLPEEDTEEYMWWETKAIEEPTFKFMFGNALACIFAPNKTPGECFNDQAGHLIDLKYYSVKVGEGEQLMDLDFGNQSDEDLIPLALSDESNVQVETVSAVVSWKTNKPATSRVVYGTESVSNEDANLAGGPLYGYATTTATFDTAPKVTDHSVTLTGLTPGETYYWRPVSSASPEVLGKETPFDTSTDDDGGEGGSGGGGSGGSGGGGGSSGSGGGFFVGGSGGTETGGGSGGSGGFVGGSTGGPTEENSLPTGNTGGNSFIAQNTGSGSGSSGSGAGVGTGDSEGAPQNEDQGGAEDERDNTNTQVAAVGFLGLSFTCGPWTSILALIVFIASVLYLFKRYSVARALITGIIEAIVIIFLLGYSCNLLLIFLVVIVLVLIGLDLAARRGTTPPPAQPGQ